MSSTQSVQQDGRWAARFRAAFTVARDVGMTGLALYGIWHQEDTGKVEWKLLLVYVVILGIIPASHAVALARSAAASALPPAAPQQLSSPATQAPGTPSPSA